MELNTIGDLVSYIETTNKNERALNDIDKLGNWKGTSAQELIRDVRGICAALKNMGLKKGAKVGIMAPPCSEWTIVDLGIMLAGCISVPLFANISEENFSFEIHQAELEVIFVGKPLAHQLAHKYKDQFRQIISLDPSSSYKNELLFKDLITQSTTEPIEPNSPDDIATIIYTSGTTSVPKGVELTHRNLVCQLAESQDRIEWNQSDRVLLFLPLSHIFGRLINYLMLISGGALYYLQDVRQLIPASKSSRPTSIVFVPRLLEKIIESVRQKIESSSAVKKSVGRWAFNLATQEKLNWFETHFCQPIADFLFYAKIRDLLGGKIKIAISGSARADPRNLHFFQRVGIPIIEGYGLTEACPVCTNSVKASQIGTLGLPFSNLEVKLSPNGELLIKGPHVMRGYYKSPELTKQAIDEEGWLHTGDICKKEEDGYYTFIGRASELCKTSYGDFIDLAKLEAELRMLPYVDYAVVLAEDRPFASALLFPNMEALDKIKERLGMHALSTEELLQLDFVKKEFERALEKVNARLNRGERVKSYRFVTNAATIEGGELSPSYKMRRKFTHDKYKRLIDEMYPVNLMIFDL